MSRLPCASYLGTQAGRDLGQPDPAGDGHTVPPAVTVVDRLVAQRGECPVRKGCVGLLGLLHAQDVRLGVADPLLHPGEPGAQGVDVPGGDAHGRRLRLRSGSAADASTSTKSSSAWQASSPPHLARPVPLAGPGRHPAQGDLEVEPVAGDHLTTEPGVLDAAEQGQLAGEPRVGQDGAPHPAGPAPRPSARRGGWGDRGSARRRRLVTGELPAAPRPTGPVRRRRSSGHEEERVAVGQVVLGSHDCRG